MTTVQAFVVTTVCESVEDFVERYHHRADARTLFVSVIEQRVMGGESAFAILLANGKPVLAGMCEVDEIYLDDKNPYGRTGMRIKIRRLGYESEIVWTKLRARGDNLDAIVEAAFGGATSQALKVGHDELHAVVREFEDEATTLPRHRPTRSVALARA